MPIARDGTLVEPTPEFPYVRVNPRTGTWARSCRPFPEEDWTDNEYLHVFWSYGFTAKKIIKAYAWLITTTWKRVRHGSTV